LPFDGIIPNSADDSLVATLDATDTDTTHGCNTIGLAGRLYLRHNWTCGFRYEAKDVAILHQPRQLARRTRRQRAHGIEIEVQVWKLSFKGCKQVEITARLRLSPTRVSRYLARRMSRIEQSASLTPVRFCMGLNRAS
jgi:hypothetical protein